MRKYLTYLFIVLIVSCRDEVENYPIEPVITFSNVEFSEAQAPGELDSLVITFSFTDGDGDFGLDREDSLPPYQRGYVFLKETGEAITSDKFFNGEISVDDLIRYSDRQNPPYDTLPDLNDACYFPGDDEKYGQDPLFWIRNENHYNLSVDFFYEDANGVFVEFDWLKDYCHSFDSRAPSKAGKDGPFIIEKTKAKGVVRYRMLTYGLVRVFGDKKIKLRMYIKDRALHNSNIAETPVFVLSDI